MTIFDRSLGLGASDAAPSVALSPYKSPYQLYCEKVLGAEIDISEKLAIEIGKALEPVIINRFERGTGLKVSRRQEIVYDPCHQWRWVTLDGMASDGALVEAKSVGFADPQEWGDEDTDEIPLPYYCQTQHALSCTDTTFCYVPVIVLNRTERLYKIERDDVFIKGLIDKQREFMEFVNTKTEPPITTLIDAKLRYPKDNGASIIATDEIRSAFIDFAAVRKTRLDAEKQEETLKIPIVRFMGEASELLDSMGNTLCTYKTQSASRLDVKAIRQNEPTIAAVYTTISNSRVMRVK